MRYFCAHTLYNIFHVVSLQQRFPNLSWRTLVSHSQTFRLTAEDLEYMAAFIGQGPRQSQLVSFSVTFRGVEM